MASIREKYGAVMMDVAWALFELRMHADPALDPNVVWSGITSQYLGIVPHPEWSLWAMRGQLIESPGYMMNYALGAMIAADVRAKVREQRGPFTTADSRLYDWLSERLYRYGRERSSREVLEDFLGRPLSADALLADLERR
jgi:carboxypeptidase Taq